MEINNSNGFGSHKILHLLTSPKPCSYGNVMPDSHALHHCLLQCSQCSEQGFFNHQIPLPRLQAVIAYYRKQRSCLHPVPEGLHSLPWFYLGHVLRQPTPQNPITNSWANITGEAQYWEVVQHNLRSQPFSNSSFVFPSPCKE